MARVWNGSNWIRRAKRLAIYIRDGFRCQYCQRDLKGLRPRLVTLDHITPVALGGSNDSTNLVTCCKNCNDRKQDRPLEAWLRGSEGMILLILIQAEQPLNLELAKSLLGGSEGTESSGY